MLLLVTVFSLSGMVTANAATIGETGELTRWCCRLPTMNGRVCIDGEYVTIVRFNVAQGETTVKLSQFRLQALFPLTAKPNSPTGSTETAQGSAKDLSLQDFTSSGNFYTSTGDEVTYTLGAEVPDGGLFR